MKKNEYECGGCKRIYERTRTDKECIEEAVENGFAETVDTFNPDDQCMICDACYKKMAKRFNFTVQ